MATDLPRFSLTMDKYVLWAVDKFQRDNHISTRNKAIQQLVKNGLNAYVSSGGKLDSLSPSDISEAAEKLAKQFDSLDSTAQDFILYVVRREISNRNQLQDAQSRISELQNQIPFHTELLQSQQNPEDFLEFDVFDEPAAAGFGNYLHEPQSRREQFPAQIIPRGANFGIRISGNSMEPQIHDGDTVFVQASHSLESGQIGIFVLNDQSYCKQLLIDRERAQIRLHSLNPDYQDIVVSESDDLWTIGKVL